MNALRPRYLVAVFLLGSLLGFLGDTAVAGPLDKVRSDGDRQAERSDRDRSRSFDRSARELPGDIPQPNPQQQANLQELRGSLSVLAGGAAAAEDEIRSLAQALQGMSLQPPDPALTQALAADLAAAMADASLSPREVAELTQAVYAVLSSAGLSQAELEVLKDDVEAILVASGVDRSDVEAVLDDLQAIYDASSAGSETRSTRHGRGSKLSFDD